METKIYLLCDIAVKKDVNEPNETLSDPIKATDWRALWYYIQGELEPGDICEWIWCLELHSRKVSDNHTQ